VDEQAAKETLAMIEEMGKNPNTESRSS